MVLGQNRASSRCLTIRLARECVSYYHHGYTSQQVLIDTTSKSNVAFNYLELLGAAQSPTKFASLDWIDQVDEQGIVAGGMEDGAITLWNIKRVCAASDT